MPAARRRVILFPLGALLALTALPILNLAFNDGPRRPVSDLFDVDFALMANGGWLRRLGVSTLPHQVIVGKSGWLFLGDQYTQAITAKRQPAGRGDATAARRSADAMQAWARWLAAHGVSHWHVLVCADKDSVYPERLPDWDRPMDGTAIDVALAHADPRIVIDTRPALRRAHALGGQALYLRTDSHWTARGAWIAYRTLARASATDTPPLAWLGEADVQLVATRVASGDLARLLHVADAGGDAATLAVVAGSRDTQRTWTDASTGAATSAAELAAVESPSRPVLVRSPHALNPQRLLWLRDSFGSAMVPYLTATFGEVVEVDRGSTTAAQLAELVLRFKPDAVLTTVVERNARAAWFEAPPP